MITPLLPTYARTDLAFDHGQGARVFTDDGREYLDFGAGIAVNALGYSHPHLVEALTTQAHKLWHVSNLHRIPEGERLAERLVEASFADTVFFTNSGAEALECSIKMARKYHSVKGQAERYRIITFEGAFHGRTLATLAAGRQDKHLAGFGPIVEGFDQVPFGDLAALDGAITRETAGILIEPVQGESGIRPVSSGILKKLRTICDENGLLLLFDEVQCGIGRTGKLFAHEWARVTPDIMAIAKAIGGGFPMGACLATEDAAHGMTAGSHGSTFGGNPLAMAVGNAVLDVVLADDFLEQVRRHGLKLAQKLARLKDEYTGVIDEIRGRGLMIGVELVKDRTTKEPAKEECARVHEAAKDLGLLLGKGGLYGNVLRIKPPMCLNAADIDFVIDALDQAFARV